MPTCQFNRVAGFTLIELLVVLVITVVLLALLFPALRAARLMAARVACGSNLRQMGLAMTLYGDDYGHHYPVVPVGGASTGASGYDRYTGWAVDLLPYLSVDGANLPQDHVFTCPLAVPEEGRTGNRKHLTYGFNSYVGTWDGSTLYNNYRPGGLRLAESGRNTTFSVAARHIPPNDNLLIFDSSTANVYWANGVSPMNTVTRQGYRHHETGINMLLLDQHVEFAAFPEADRQYYLGPGLRVTDQRINYHYAPQWN